MLITAIRKNMRRISSAYVYGN